MLLTDTGAVFRNCVTKVSFHVGCWLVDWLIG